MAKQGGGDGGCCMIVTLIVMMLVFFFNSEGAPTVQEVQQGIETGASKAKETLAQTVNAAAESAATAKQAMLSATEQAREGALLAADVGNKMRASLTNFSMNFNQTIAAMSIHVDALREAMGDAMRTCETASRVAVNITTAVARSALTTMKWLGQKGMNAGKATLEQMCKDVPTVSEMLHEYSPKLDCVLHHILQLMSLGLKLLGFLCTGYLLLMWPYDKILRLGSAGAVLYLSYRTGAVGWVLQLMRAYLQSPLKFISYSFILRLTVPLIATGLKGRAVCGATIAYMIFRELSWTFIFTCTLILCAPLALDANALAASVQPQVSTLAEACANGKVSFAVLTLKLTSIVAGTMQHWAKTVQEKLPLKLRLALRELFDYFANQSHAAISTAVKEAAKPGARQPIHTGTADTLKALSELKCQVEKLQASIDEMRGARPSTGMKPVPESRINHGRSVDLASDVTGMD
jgi:hypothetical protein